MAQDAKLVSGVDCKFLFGGPNTTSTNYGGFTNTHSQTEYVSCPIVKDNISGSIVVNLLTSSGVVASSCRLVRRPYGGGSLSHISYSSLSVPSSGYQYITWNSTSANATALDLYCSVPSGETIYSIQHSE